MMGSGTMGSGMGGMMGSGTMGSGMAHNVPGAVLDMCHESGDMPPHYCEPTYHAATSVPAVKVSTVDIMDEKTLMVNLREVYSMTEGVNQRLVVVGGNGHLAGATIVESGWQGTNTVHLSLVGTGSIFDHGGLHVHVFPYTGE
jgi:leucyl aminopeptidase